MRSDIVPTLVASGGILASGKQLAPAGSSVLAGGVAYDPESEAVPESNSGCVWPTKEGNECNGRGVRGGICVGHRKARDRV